MPLRQGFEATVRSKSLLARAFEATVRSKSLLERAFEATVRSKSLLGHSVALHHFALLRFNPCMYMHGLTLVYIYIYGWVRKLLRRLRAPGGHITQPNQRYHSTCSSRPSLHDLLQKPYKYPGKLTLYCEWAGSFGHALMCLRRLRCPLQVSFVHRRSKR